jgi:hypothetical protein
MFVNFQFTALSSFIYSIREREREREYGVCANHHIVSSVEHFITLCFSALLQFSQFFGFQLFRPEYHWRDLISRNAHLVHQNWYRISFTSKLQFSNTIWSLGIAWYGSTFTMLFSRDFCIYTCSERDSSETMSCIQCNTNYHSSCTHVPVSQNFD